MFSKAFNGVAPNCGAVFICRILRGGSVRIFVFDNPTVRLGAVLSKGKSYGAVRSGSNREKPHCTVPAPYKFT